MAYLPGVPDMGPAPAGPTISPSMSSSMGKPRGIAAVAGSVGKPGRTQHLGSIVGRRGAGMSSIGGGDPGLHSVNHYGKTAPPLLGGGPTGGINPTAHAGVKMIRGGAGGIRSNVREGGLGPGKMSTPGPSFQDYSISNNQDVE